MPGAMAWRNVEIKSQDLRELVQLCERQKESY